MWQNGGVSLSPRGVAAVAGVECSKEDALGETRKFFLESMKHITFKVFSCVLFFDSKTPSEWLWLWLSPAFSCLSFSLSIHTHTHINLVTIIVYYISWSTLYFLVLTNPAPAWVLVKASFSTSDTIVTLYRHWSTNRFVSLDTRCIYIYIHKKIGVWISSHNHWYTLVMT